MEKNNKLIAEFMGLDSFKDSLASLHQGKINVDVDVYEQAQYHTSWDWLMPVIEKCLVREAEQSEEISNTTIKNIYEGICNQDISFAYKAVVEFIKNQND